MQIAIYDATITEGTREAGVQLSVRDRLRIALRLAEAGVAFVEAGWAGGRGADVELFRQARRLELGGTRLCACVSHATGTAARESAVRAALHSGAPAVKLSVGVWGAPARRRRAADARRADGARTTRQLTSDVRAIRAGGRAAIVELEDFFDAVRQGDRTPLALVEAAARSGAEAVLLSDTSGGALPYEVEAGVTSARRCAGRMAVGVRARDDAGVAVANSLAAIAKGATIVAATVNGFGERCGAADLVSIAAALELKMGHQALAPGQLRRASSLAYFVAELADRETPRRQPYVGRDAFAMSRRGSSPHVDPDAVGNRVETAMADERGHPDALRVARALGLPARGEADARRVLARLAAWERRGFRYEGAEASFELLLRAVAGKRRTWFKVLAYRVLDVRRERQAFTEATVEVAVGGERVHTAAEGVGPVNALDRALRRALEGHYPELQQMKLVQSRSRNLGSGTAGEVRLHLESADERDLWGTAGVSDNLLDACSQALVDAIEYKLFKDDIPVRRNRE